MLFRVDHAKSIPLGDQIAACVRGGLADGTVHGGDRLPAARELSASLEVSIHTVLAGYQQLRDEGLIELRRGRGAIVSSGIRAERVAVDEQVERLVEAARRIGLDDDELVGLVQRKIAAMASR